MAASPSPSLEALLGSLLPRAAGARHRYCLALAGSHGWCLETARAVMAHAAWPAVAWISDRAPPGQRVVDRRQAASLLGQELDGVVYDAFGGFDPDAFGAVAGTIHGGGLLVLLIPPLTEWPRYQDPEHQRLAVYPLGPEAVTGRFLGRLARLLAQDPGVVLFQEGQAPPHAPVVATPAPAAPPKDPDCRTQDQCLAVAALLKVMRGKRRRPVVLTADRGRGKSAALGIAAARLMNEGQRHIVVTAPRLEAAGPVFQQAGERLAGAAVSRAAVHWRESRLEFLPPDELVRQPRAEALLLVDEAAAIPAAVLERLLMGHPRIAFATTVHGYEGTGRGFALRFHRILDQRSRGWRALRLEAPIRWAAGDPLEAFVFRALLLDAAPAPEAAIRDAGADGVSLERVDRDVLARDNATLGQLFGLLVLAHYRTRPYDLRYLLDGPNISVYIMRHGGHVVATALVAGEGGFDPDTARRVWAGRSRPHGHLLPESLAAHLGLEQAATLRCARIMRIAVHPEVQGRGLGTRLVKAIADAAAHQGLDYVGASFGAAPGLLDFWDRCGLRPIRFSVKRGTTSGLHSAIMVQPLNDRGAAMAHEAQARFHQGLPFQLGESLAALDPPVAAWLLGRGGRTAQGLSALDEQDWRDLAAFGHFNRLYEVSLPPLWKLTTAMLADAEVQRGLPATQCHVLIIKVLQRRGWSEAATALGLAGKTEVVTLLRQAVRSLLEAVAEPGVRAWLEALGKA